MVSPGRGQTVLVAEARGWDGRCYMTGTTRPERGRPHPLHVEETEDDVIIMPEWQHELERKREEE